VPQVRRDRREGRERCAGCDELSGSISAGSGFPVVRERSTGRYYHVRCRPESPSDAVAGIC
jgi:hypothetical protein